MSETSPSQGGNNYYDYSRFVMPTDATAEETKIYDSFTAELTDDDDAPPVYACRDAKYFLTLQREKMKRQGISVQESLKPAGAIGKVIGVTYESPMYTVRRLSREFIRKSVYRLNGKRIYTYKDKLNLYQTLVNAKQGLPHNARYVCPNCGAVSTIAELESGCKYCGTRFIMSELFPKVTEHYWLRAYSMGKGEMGPLVLKFTLGTIALCLAAGLILDVSGVWNSIFSAVYPKNDFTPATVMFGIMGLMGGPFLALMSLFWRVMIDAVKTVPLMSRVAGSRKKLYQTLRQRDLYFFYEAFESRVISLFKIMVYGEDLSNNAAYFGEKPVPQSDIIEAVYRGAMELESIITENNYTTVTINFFASCLHLKGRRMVRKNNEYRMMLVRNASAVTDQGFSIIKVECPSCGGSFDATRSRRCTHCGRDYHLYDFDWAVYSFEKIK